MIINSEFCEMKKLRSNIKRTIRIIIILILLAVGVVYVFRFINARKYKISTSEGIQESEYIRVNDCDIYLQIRGENKENPVIIFVHGGPGFPLTYLSAYHQYYLESAYTFVNFDQRNSGRTFYKNQNDPHDPTVEDMVHDLKGVVTYVKKKLGKEKVIIMGQSWGSVLGTLYSQKYSQDVLAYIGVGQVIDFDKGKIFAAEKALEVARIKDNENDINILTEAVYHFKTKQDIEEVAIDTLNTLILTSMKYLKCEGEMSPMKQMFSGITSPDMSVKDIQWFWRASNTDRIIESQKTLINYMYYTFNANDYEEEYKVPMYYIQGACDYITPTEMVEAYYNVLNAPKKRLIKIENTGHTPFLDDPVAFAKAVRSIVEN